MEIQQEFHNSYSPKTEEPPPPTGNSLDRLQEYVDRVQSNDISSVYPQKEYSPERLDYTDRSDGKEKTLQLGKEL